MTFASATTAGGSEIALNVFLGHAPRVALSRNLLGQPEEHLAPHVRRQFGRVPRQEEPGRPSRVTRITSSDRNISLARSQKSRTVTTLI